MAENWREYQQEAAEFFCLLGLNARTDETVEGARTKHAVDVVVTSQHAGFEVTWLVECKFWKTPVSKLHVLGLRQIVIDTGADRGILLSESGFQSGAAEAAALTNVRLATLASLRETASAQVHSMRLKELHERLESCNDRYWSISKADRIARGLRVSAKEIGYSAGQVITLTAELLKSVSKGAFPIEVGFVLRFHAPFLPERCNSVESCIAAVQAIVDDLDMRLHSAGI